MKIYTFNYKTGRTRRISVIEESLEKALYYLNHVKKLNLEFLVYEKQSEVTEYVTRKEKYRI